MCSQNIQHDDTFGWNIHAEFTQNLMFIGSIRETLSSENCVVFD